MMTMDERFVGAWILVDTSFQLGEEPIYPLGEHPVGMLILTEKGFLSAQLSTADRDRFDAETRVGGSEEEKLAAFDSYMAYAGMTRLEDDRLVTTVMMSLYPNWTGGEQVRQWRFEGEHLVLSGGMPMGDEEMTFDLTWRRV